MVYRWMDYYAPSAGGNKKNKLVIIVHLCIANLLCKPEVASTLCAYCPVNLFFCVRPKLVLVLV